MGDHGCAAPAAGGLHGGGRGAAADELRGEAAASRVRRDAFEAERFGQNRSPGPTQADRFDDRRADRPRRPTPTVSCPDRMSSCTKSRPGPVRDDGVELLTSVGELEVQRVAVIERRDHDARGEVPVVDEPNRCDRVRARTPRRRRSAFRRSQAATSPLAVHCAPTLTVQNTVATRIAHHLPHPIRRVPHQPAGRHTSAWQSVVERSRIEPPQVAARHADRSRHPSDP